MANDIEYLVSLNNEYLYSCVNGSIYAPLRFTQDSVDKIEQALATRVPNSTSCIKKMSLVSSDGRFVLDTEFNTKHKCMQNLSTPLSMRTKTEMCTRHLCTGKCCDEFMHDIVAKNLLPELYNTKQK